MKKILATLLLVLSIVSCTTTNQTGERTVDPVATGQIIGLAYTLTKDKLEEGDRKNIEAAYAIFTDVANLITDQGGVDGDSIKYMLLAEVDGRIYGPDYEAKRAAVRAIINIYWDRIDAKYDIGSMLPSDQLYMLKQLQLGIEQGLGR